MCQKSTQELQAHETLSEKTLYVQLHVTSSVDNKDSSKNCAEENILKQWQEVRLKRHKEFIHLKSIEKSARNYIFGIKPGIKPQIIQS